MKQSVKVQTTGTPPAASRARAKKPWYRQLYVQVLVAIVLGITVGALWPTVGQALQPIGTTFIAVMKMLIGPIVFLTIIGGIASVADLKKVGLTGLKALTYFQVGTIIAMVTGLVAINLVRLGDGVNADPSTIQTNDAAAEEYISTGETKQWWEFLTHLVPESFFGAVRQRRHPPGDLPGRALRHRPQGRRPDRRAGHPAGSSASPRSCSRC